MKISPCQSQWIFSVKGRPNSNAFQDTSSSNSTPTPSHLTHTTSGIPKHVVILRFLVSTVLFTHFFSTSLYSYAHLTPCARKCMRCCAYVHACVRSCAEDRNTKFRRQSSQEVSCLTVDVPNPCPVIYILPRAVEGGRVV